jgi:hypothetical protein
LLEHGADPNFDFGLANVRGRSRLNGVADAPSPCDRRWTKTRRCGGRMALFVWRTDVTDAQSRAPAVVRLSEPTWSTSPGSP